MGATSRTVQPAHNDGRRHSSAVSPSSRVTHRAVDAAADLPAGSTSNYFRSRDALFEGVVERFAARERAVIAELSAAADPSSAEELADLLAAFVVTATTDRRELTLARFALLVEAANRPHLQRALVAAAEDIGLWATSVMAAVGSPDPGPDASLIGGQVDVLTLRQLAYPDPDFDPAPALRTLITALLARPGSR